MPSLLAPIHGTPFVGGTPSGVILVTAGGLQNLLTLPGTTTVFLRGDGTFAAPTGGAHDAITLATSADTILALSGQELALDKQAKNLVWAGPATGADATPTFRSLVGADFPSWESVLSILDINASGVVDNTDVSLWSTARGNWNAAYGWGNHASAGYAAAAHNHSGVYEPAGATATHAALTTGVHGLAITAGQTLTVTTGGTLGSAAYTASGDYATAGHNHSGVYEVAGAVSSHASLTTGVHGLLITAGQTLTVTTGGTLGSAAYTASGDYATAGHNHSGVYEVAGAVSSHASLTTGVHGLLITAGQTLTVTTGGTLGSAAYTASGDYATAGHNHSGVYEPAGAIATHAALTTGVHGLAITAGQTLTVTTGGTLGSAAYTASTDYATAGHTHAQLHDRSHAITGTSDHTAGNWKVLYSNGSGQITELALGADGEYLKSNGAAAAPTFATPSGAAHDAVTLAASVTDVLSLSTQALGAVDAGADKLAFWDDSEAKLSYATLGTYLSFTAATLNVAAPKLDDCASPDDNTDLDVSTSSHGLCPKAPTGTIKFLRADATWDIPLEIIGIACSDETTALTTGTGKVTFRMPFAFTLTEVRSSVTTAPTGSTLIVDINEGGATILSTKLSIDASEKTSTTAATAAVISDSALADDAEITIDIDQIGSPIAGAGLKIWLIGKRA